MTWRIEHRDCIEAMPVLADASIDAVVCDPPYGLEFMGREWDRLAGTPGYNERGRITDRPDAQVPYGRGGGVNSYQAGRPMQDWHEAWAREALRVLKPGGYLLAFGGSRTAHRLAAGVEDAGFEIRDEIMWLYGTGFPKAANPGRQLADEHRHPGDFRHREAAAWEGHGTALKPGHEPIVVARKPLAATVARNVLEHGTGALNIDGCRVGHASADDLAASQAKNPGREDVVTSGVYGAGRPQQRVNAAGRWPANVVLTHAEDCREACVEGCPVGELDRLGGVSRFFYTAKTSAAERNAGLDGFERRDGRGYAGGPLNRPEHESSDGAQRSGARSPRANTHPTVKPLALMRWLVRLVTPPGGVVLDPFAGSGSTGCAAVLEGFDFLGIERQDTELEPFVSIAVARVAWWEGNPEGLASAREREAVAEAGQLEL